MYIITLLAARGIPTVSRGWEEASICLSQRESANCGTRCKVMSLRQRPRTRCTLTRPQIMRNVGPVTTIVLTFSTVEIGLCRTRFREFGRTLLHLIGCRYTGRLVVILRPVPQPDIASWTHSTLIKSVDFSNLGPSSVSTVYCM